MILNDFRTALLEMGSDASTWANKNLFGGVQGMPITHQVGFGAALRNGIHPNQVNVDQMNDEVHIRMLAVFAGLSGGTNLLSVNDSLVKLFGAVATGVSSYYLIELMKDWQAGLKAAKMLDERYWNRMGKRRPLFHHEFSFQNLTIKSPVKMLGNNQKPTKKPVIRLGRGSMLGNNPGWE